MIYVKGNYIFFTGTYREMLLNILNELGRALGLQINRVNWTTRGNA